MDDARGGATRCLEPDAPSRAAAAWTTVSMPSGGITRRQMIGVVGAALIGLPWIGGGLGSLAEFLSVPQRSFAGAMEPSELDVGSVSGLADGVPDVVMFGAETVFVVKHGSSIVALSATCPFRGCKMAYHADKKLFMCPCDHSTFDLTGERIAGPASRDMYKHFVRVSRGRIILGRRTDLSVGASGAPIS